MPKTINLTEFSACERSYIGLNRKIAQMQRVFFEELIHYPHFASYAGLNICNMYFSFYAEHNRYKWQSLRSLISLFLLRSDVHINKLDIPQTNCIFFVRNWIKLNELLTYNNTSMFYMHVMIICKQMYIRSSCISIGVLLSIETSGWMSLE